MRLRAASLPLLLLALVLAGCAPGGDGSNARDEDSYVGGMPYRSRVYSYQLHIPDDSAMTTHEFTEQVISRRIPSSQPLPVVEIRVLRGGVDTRAETRTFDAFLEEGLKAGCPARAPCSVVLSRKR